VRLAVHAGRWWAGGAGLGRVDRACSTRVNRHDSRPANGVSPRWLRPYGGRPAWLVPSRAPHHGLQRLGARNARGWIERIPYGVQPRRAPNRARCETGAMRTARPPITRPLECSPRWSQRYERQLCVLPRLRAPADETFQASRALDSPRPLASVPRLCPFHATKRPEPCRARHRASQVAQRGVARTADGAVYASRC